MPPKKVRGVKSNQPWVYNEKRTSVEITHWNKEQANVTYQILESTYAQAWDIFMSVNRFIIYPNVLIYE